MTTSNHTAHYSKTPFGEGGLKGWLTKQAGPAPTEGQFATAHGLGLRPGKQAMAFACALRDGGVSGSQITLICGAPQLNKMRGEIKAGTVKRDATAPRNPQGQSVYKLTLSAKGEAAIKRAADKLAATQVDGDAKGGKAKAKKAKATTTPRKPRAAKVTAPTVDAGTADAAPQAPVTGDAGTGDTAQV